MSKPKPKKRAFLSYIPRDSVVHALTGTSKLLFFIAWTVTAMVTYDTRVLVAMLVIGLVVFAMTRIHVREISFALKLALVFLLLNNLFVYLFSPEYGCELYHSRTLLLTGIGKYTVTAEQLFYHFNMTLKTVVVIPISVLFIACTNPSEFAASLAGIGISYRIGFCVSLALRYIPDVQREYHTISQAAQARGVDLSKKDHVLTRLKNSTAILLPLIMSSLERIETVSNAMELRGFGRKKHRTWYMRRPIKRNDIITIVLAALLLGLGMLVTFYDGSRFYNPFVPPLS